MSHCGCNSFPRRPRPWNRRRRPTRIPPVYGEFLQTITGVGVIEVAPNAAIAFPIEAVPKGDLIYSASPAGLLVRDGVYQVETQIAPVPGVDGGEVTLMVNGAAPVSSNNVEFTRAEFDVAGLVSQSNLIVAPLRRRNLISLVNTGVEAFSLGALPGTTDGTTSTLVRVVIKRVSNLPHSH